MKLTKEQRELLQEALLDAFSSPATLRQMVRHKLDKNLDSIAMGRNLKEITFNLIDISQEEGWTADLIKAASEANPRNPTLLAFVQQVELPITMPSEQELEELKEAVPTQDRQQWEPLEALLADSAPMQDIAKLIQRTNQICRIEISGYGDYSSPKGTGFLLGPDVVMTNYHVMQPVIEGRRTPNDFIFRFDHKQIDGKVINQGQVYGLAKQNWLIDSSPMSQLDLVPEPKNGVPNPDELDYALVRLDGQPGNSPIGQNPQPNAPKRGWIEVPSQKPHLVTDNPLYILQHPGGGPLKLGFGRIGDLNQNQTRLTYDTNTQGGSSGSPCFNTNWDLVALHHATEPKLPHTYNQGIPFTSILMLLKERKKLSYLGQKGSPAESIAPSTAPSTAPSSDAKQANNARKPDLRILQIVEDSYFITGDGFDAYKVGTDLVVYHSTGTQAKVPIGLLRVTAKNPNNLQAQAILLHPKHQIIANLLVRERTDDFRTRQLIPAYQEAAGYFLKKGLVVLRLGIKVTKGTIIEAFEPEIDQGEILDYYPFESPIRLQINQIGTKRNTARVKLLEGTWPQKGTVVCISDVREVRHDSPPQPDLQEQPKMTVPELRHEISTTFNGSELDDFLHDHYPYVDNNIGRGMQQNEKITMLLRYCRQRDGLSELQALVEKYKRQLGIS